MNNLHTIASTTKRKAILALFIFIVLVLITSIGLLFINQPQEAQKQTSNLKAASLLKGLCEWNKLQEANGYIVKLYEEGALILTKTFGKDGPFYIRFDAKDKIRYRCEVEIIPIDPKCPARDVADVICPFIPPPTITYTPTPIKPTITPGGPTNTPKPTEPYKPSNTPEPSYPPVNLTNTPIPSTPPGQPTNTPVPPYKLTNTPKPTEQIMRKIPVEPETPTNTPLPTARVVVKAPTNTPIPTEKLIAQAPTNTPTQQEAPSATPYPELPKAGILQTSFIIFALGFMIVLLGLVI